jgi:hypothetical protein
VECLHWLFSWSFELLRGTFSFTCGSFTFSFLFFFFFCFFLIFMLLLWSELLVTHFSLNYRMFAVMLWSELYISHPFFFLRFLVTIFFLLLLLFLTIILFCVSFSSGEGECQWEESKHCGGEEGDKSNHSPYWPLDNCRNMIGGEPVNYWLINEVVVYNYSVFLIVVEIK